MADFLNEANSAETPASRGVGLEFLQEVAAIIRIKNAVSAQLLAIIEISLVYDNTLCKFQKLSIISCIRTWGGSEYYE